MVLLAERATETSVTLPSEVAVPPRKGCRFCGAALEHIVVDLGMSPLANAYLRPSDLDKAERFYPLRAFVCAECFLVQLEEWESPKAIFGDYAYFSSISDSWLAHARRYVAEVTARFEIGSQSQVVEIASNDGYLLQYFLERQVPILGIEPARNVAEAARRRSIPTLCRFFGEETARGLLGKAVKADLLIGNNVLAHVPNLNDFVRGLKLLLAEDGVITLEFPHLMRLMAESQFDTIYHEHFSYFSLLAVDRLFTAHGLTVFDVEELPTHGGSLRVYARHSGHGSRPVERRVAELYRREAEFGLADLARYATFGDAVREAKRSLLGFLIAAKRAGKRVVGYGAPAKGNTLLNYCGVRTDFLDYTVDRSPHKQGLFLPGTRIPIEDPSHVRETKPDYLLILPWNLRAEVMEQMAFIRGWGGRFVVPIPETRVLE